VFHHSLPKYLSDDLERVQKRALSILSPGVSYPQNLEKFDLSSLLHRRKELCDQLVFKITRDSSHNLHNLLPPKHETKLNLRKKRTFNIPHIHTNRHKNTFVHSMSNQNIYELRLWLSISYIILCTFYVNMYDVNFHAIQSMTAKWL
jgi:hypothetical protein